MILNNFNLKLKKGDNVVVSVGRDRGKKGKIERVWPKEMKVLVTGVNQYKKHTKKQQDRTGEIVVLSRPINTSKIALVCPKCKQTTRVGYRIQDGKKIRICRKCKADIN